MARLVVITHRDDRLCSFRLRSLRFHGHYLMHDILRAMRRRGHKIVVQQGIPSRPLHGDAAMLHVDTTVTPQEYIDLAATFPRCINLGVTDISKRRISGAVLNAGDAWDGPVIVKSNANAGGRPEARLNRRARDRGEPEPFPGSTETSGYDIFDGVDKVSRDRFGDPSLVVERFIPEPDPAGYALRCWVFCGEEERCNRFVSARPIVKASNVVRWEPVEVPDQLRALRRTLGFDYGKFDFVIHEGRPVLLDANKTVGRAVHMDEVYLQQVRRFASGLERLIASP